MPSQTCDQWLQAHIEKHNPYNGSLVCPCIIYGHKAKMDSFRNHLRAAFEAGFQAGEKSGIDAVMEAQGEIGLDEINRIF